MMMMCSTRYDTDGVNKNEMMMMPVMCSTNHDKFHQIEVSHSQNEIISFTIQDFLELRISEFSLNSESFKICYPPCLDIK